MRGLVENDSLVSIEQNAIFDMPAHGAGEYNFLQIAALLQQVIQGVAVGDANYVLLDDRAVVENIGYVVAGGAESA